jgi:hypothetical protein
MALQDHVSLDRCKDAHEAEKRHGGLDDSNARFVDGPRIE